MFPVNHCGTPSDKQRYPPHTSNMNFIQTVLEENRRAQALHDSDIRRTAENPRIREQEETTALCRELSAHTHEQFNEDKRRQQRRENNVQIRQLQSQLGAAYVAKELAQQKAARLVALQAAGDAKKAETAEQKRRQRLTDETVLREELQRCRDKEAFRHVLLGQMEEKRERGRQQLEEVKADHRSMIELQQRLEEAQRAEVRELARRKQQQMVEIKKCMEVQAKLQQAKQAEGQAEHEQFERMLRDKEVREQHAKLAKRAIKAQKELLSENIGRQLFRLQNEKRDHENQLLDLLVEEQRAKDDERYKQSLGLKQQERQKIYTELEHYQDIVASKKERVRTDNEFWLQHQQQALAERDRLHQLATERSRQKAQQQGTAAQSIIEANRRDRFERAKEEQQAADNRCKADEQKQIEIRDECQLIINSEAPDVLRFVPKHYMAKLLSSK